jgi:hypothetical protein
MSGVSRSGEGSAVLMGITITPVASGRRLLTPLDPLDSRDETLFG